MSKLRRNLARKLGVSQRVYFKGAEQGRLTMDWVTSPLSADDELRSDLRLLRNRSRELARNSPIIRQYLGMLVTNVIGPNGFTHQAKVEDNSGRANDRLNDEVEDGWKRWGKRVSLDGKLGLIQFQQQALSAVARDGEVLVRKWRTRTSVNPFAFALELIDASLLDERMNVSRSATANEVRMGVEVDAIGRPVAYHVWTRPESTLTGAAPRERLRIPAEDVLHLYDPERVNQTRGVPWTAAAMYPLRMLEGYIEAEIVAARTAATSMGFFVRREGATPGSIETDDKGVVITEASPGTFDFAPEGYELQNWSPDHPNAVFPEFVKGALRQVATALRVSYNALANDLEGVNYSSMRSGLLIERDTWRGLQRWWMDAFLSPVYEAWMEQARLTGEMKLDTRKLEKLQRHEFIGRGWPWVDPLKDASAGEQALANGLTSRTRLLAEQGLDVESVFRELKREQELAEAHGIKLKDAQPPPPALPNAPGKGEGDPESEQEDTKDDEVDVEAKDESATPSRNGHGSSYRSRIELGGMR